MLSVLITGTFASGERPSRMRGKTLPTIFEETREEDVLQHIKNLADQVKNQNSHTPGKEKKNTRRSAFYIPAQSDQNTS